MVKNVELSKEVGEKKEKNKLLEEALEEMKVKLEEVVDATKKKHEEEDKEKGKVIVDEDVVPKLDPILTE